MVERNLSTFRLISLPCLQNLHLFVMSKIMDDTSIPAIPSETPAKEQEMSYHST